MNSENDSRNFPYLTGQIAASCHKREAELHLCVINHSVKNREFETGCEKKPHTKSSPYEEEWMQGETWCENFLSWSLLYGSGSSFSFRNIFFTIYKVKKKCPVMGKNCKSYRIHMIPF